MAANPYAFDGTQRADTAALNRVTADVDGRLKRLEQLAPEIEVAKDSLVAIGLQRLNTELLPTILLEQARVERGVLLAASETPAQLLLGATLNLVVDEADRMSFSPSAFVMLTRTTTVHDYATLQTANWDRGTGIYTGLVVGVAGDPGPWADWQLGSQAGSTLAQLAQLAAGEAAASTATDAATAAHADRTAADAASASAAASAAQAQRFAGGSAFNAASATLIAPIVGQVAAVLTPDTAQGFIVSAFAALVSRSDPSTTMLGRLVGFDAGTGTLTLNVYSFTGLAPRADWIITPTPPPFIPSGIDGGWADGPTPTPGGAVPFYNAPVIFTGVSGGIDGGFADDGSGVSPDKVAFGGIGAGLTGTDGGYA